MSNHAHNWLMLAPIRRLGWLLAEGYRNGINHQFLPKPTTAIVKEQSDDRLIYKENGYYVLNVFLLGRMFIKSLNRVKEKLEEKDVREHVNKRYAKWAEHKKFDFPPKLHSLLGRAFPDLISDRNDLKKLAQAPEYKPTVSGVKHHFKSTGTKPSP